MAHHAIDFISQQAASGMHGLSPPAPARVYHTSSLGGAGTTHPGELSRLVAEAVAAGFRSLDLTSGSSRPHGGVSNRAYHRYNGRPPDDFDVGPHNPTSPRGSGATPSPGSSSRGSADYSEECSGGYYSEKAHDYLEHSDNYSGSHSGSDSDGPPAHVEAYSSEESHTSEEGSEGYSDGSQDADYVDDYDDHGYSDDEGGSDYSS